MLKTHQKKISSPCETIQFSIKGNGIDSKGNPKPKLKMTGAQHWLPGAKDYVLWKDHVRASLLDAVRYQPIYTMLIRNMGTSPTAKPFKTSRELKAKMSLLIRWKGHSHGDPENIFGSIADALFSQDKYLAGEFDYVQCEEGDCGSVDVTITLQEV